MALRNTGVGTELGSGVAAAQAWFRDARVESGLRLAAK